MARRHDPRIREALKAKAVDYVIEHGMSGLSLRPLAKALHTNARMLIYHFGSREGLMREILMGLRERESAKIDAWFRSGRRPRTLPDFLRWLWRQLNSPQAQFFARVLFELYALALRHPDEYPGVLEEPLRYWQSLLRRAGIPVKTRAAQATLLLATTRGLLLDVISTGERARVRRALNLLIDWTSTLG